MAMKRDRISPTLSSMGLRAEASLAKHLLQENCWKNNLVADISKVDYLEGHQGRTNLHLLEGLSLFADDYYVYGVLDQAETVHVRGRKVSCEPAAKQIVARISLVVQKVLGGPRKKHKNLAHRACKHKRLQNPGNNCENRERNRAAGKKAVKKLFPEKEVYAFFIAKIDVSEVEITQLQECLPTLARHLENRGDGTYQIEYPGLLRSGRQKNSG